MRISGCVLPHKPARTYTLRPRGHLHCLKGHNHEQGMTDKTFFADADTPFHVWVRECCGAQGYRWVLRHASQVIGAMALGAAGGDGAVVSDPRASGA